MPKSDFPHTHVGLLLGPNPAYASRSSPVSDAWRIICPACSSADLTATIEGVRCEHCQHEVANIDGIWRCLPESRLKFYRKFLETYTLVRVAEGRGSYDADTLRALPECPANHDLAWQWSIRARSFRSLLELLRTHSPAKSRILDLGAGTGWLSHRLQQEGYRPCAIDLSVDSKDGLGAARNFDSQWPRLQAEYDHIPVADEQADAVIFNASFHYCNNREQAIREALRVLVSGGLLIIVDSPFYRLESSGKQMLEEQQQYFEKLIGQRSDSLSSTGYLTWKCMDVLSDCCNLKWRYERPWYGYRWALRPWISKLRRQREPASFVIAWVRKP